MTKFKTNKKKLLLGSFASLAALGAVAGVAASCYEPTKKEPVKTPNPNQGLDNTNSTGSTTDSILTTVVDSNLPVTKEFQDKYKELTEADRKNDWFTSWDPNSTQQPTGLALLIVQADKKLNSSYQDKQGSEELIAQVTNLLTTKTGEKVTKVQTFVGTTQFFNKLKEIEEKLINAVKKNSTETLDQTPDVTQAPTVSLSEQTLITKTDNGYELSLNLENADNKFVEVQLQESGQTNKANSKTKVKIENKKATVVFDNLKPESKYKVVSVKVYENADATQPTEVTLTDELKAKELEVVDSVEQINVDQSTPLTHTFYEEYKKLDATEREDTKLNQKDSQINNSVNKLILNLFEKYINDKSGFKHHFQTLEPLLNLLFESTDVAKIKTEVEKEGQQAISWPTLKSSLPSIKDLLTVLVEAEKNLIKNQPFAYKSISQSDDNKLEVTFEATKQNFDNHLKGRQLIVTYIYPSILNADGKDTSTEKITINQNHAPKDNTNVVKIKTNSKLESGQKYTITGIYIEGDGGVDLKPEENLLPASIELTGKTNQVSAK